MNDQQYKPLLSINPATNETIEEHQQDSDLTANEKIANASRSFSTWKATPLTERIEYIRAIGQQLEERKESLAETMTGEMGKLFQKSIAELEKTQWLIDYYCDHAPAFLAKEEVATQYPKSYVSFEPMGTILCIMPWNFPYWQVFRFAIPALLAGNTVLLKHASNVQGCAKEIASLFKEAPAAIFQNLSISSDRVEEIIARPEIRGVSLTGSSAAGRSVAAAAGRSMKKCVFELGGSDPYIILEDADLSRAVKACVTGRLMNAGQSCIGAKRFILSREISEEFIRQFKAAFESVKMGDPMSPETGIAPMASIRLRDELHQQVVDSIALGAKCITGGYIPKLTGAYYPPTILTDVRKGMPAYDQELFGPVASVLVADSEDEAVAIANDTPFGLGAAIFSENVERAEAIIREKIEAGCCFINDFVRSDPRLPFGGVKESGYGRELSKYGILEFCNIKTVVLT